MDNEIYIGDANTVTITFPDTVGLIGRVVLLTIKKDVHLSDDQAVVAKSTANSEGTIDAPNHKVMFPLSYDDTINIQPGTYKCNARIVNNGVPISTKNFDLQFSWGTTRRIS